MSVTKDVSRVRKMPIDSHTSPSKKLKIVERYSMYTSSNGDPGHYAKMSYNRRMNYLEAEIKKRTEELKDIHTSSLDCRANNDKLEFNKCELEDDINELSRELQLSHESIKNLHEMEQESLQSIKKMFEVKKKEMLVQHDEKLMKMKETTSDEIKAAFEAAHEKLVKKNLQLTDEIAELSANIQMHTTEMNRKLIKLKEDHHKKLLLLTSNLNDMLAELENDAYLLEKEIGNKNHDIDSLKNLIVSELDQKTSVLHENLSSLQLKFATKESELAGLSSKIVSARQRIDYLQSTFHSKMDKIKSYQTSAAEMTSAFPALELQRRSLHNCLQELKGNIRVFCRIRPPLELEEPGQIEMLVDTTLNENGKQHLLITRDGDSTQELYRMSSKGKTNSHEFEFDQIFDQNTSNMEIFSEISQLIQSGLDGYNVCVFAYGQTGSGKTFTMANEGDGMIPLSIKKIYEDIANLETQGWKYEVKGQFVEIYNEQIIDLLSPTNESQKHEIKHDDETGLTTITNVVSVQMSNVKAAVDTLVRATKKRSTASTKANERSSRSHSVFIISLKGVHLELGKESQGTLNLIDLAGSERLNHSQAKGDRLKETQAINKSLSSLGDVIHNLTKQQALGAQSSHIPYRNSKLTYLLKNSLGGDSKTLMFVNISPLTNNYNETVNSLRFATKVNNTKLA